MRKTGAGGGSDGPFEAGLFRFAAVAAAAGDRASGALADAAAAVGIAEDRPDFTGVGLPLAPETGGSGGAVEAIVRGRLGTAGSGEGRSDAAALAQPSRSSSSGVDQKDAGEDGEDEEDWKDEEAAMVGAAAVAAAEAVAARTVVELKAELRSLGLPVGGRKAELVERLLKSKIALAGASTEAKGSP